MKAPRAMAWLDRNMGFAVLAGTLLVLSGMTYAATKDVPVKESITKRVELRAGAHLAAISLSKGTEKPIVASLEGRTLLDVSAWESLVKVGNETHALYRDAYNTASDARVAYVTWSAPTHQVEERIEVDEGGVTIRWSWLRDPQAPAGDAVLELAQFAYLMHDASYDGEAIRYRLDAADPRHPPLLTADPRPYRVSVSLDRQPELVWFGETPEGVDGVHLRYRIRDAPPGEQVPIFTQRITYDRSDAPLPPPFGERRAIPALDAPAREVQLAAGDLRASLPLFHGGQKPVLRDAAGRELVEVSGWESTLRLDGEAPVPLYRHAYDVRHDDESATVTWMGEGYALEERATLTDAGLTLAWSWLRDEDAPARNATLDLAHFSRYMEDAASDGARVAWRMNGSDTLVQAAFDPAPARLRFGNGSEGMDAFRATFRIEDAPPGARAHIANLTLTLPPGGAVPLLGPPAESVARPVEDHAAGVILLGAGDTRAVFATGRGAQQPVLRTAEGRDLLEVSSRGSLVRFDAEPWRDLSLSAYDHRHFLDGDRACALYEDGAFALRECVRVTSANATVSWEWRRAPGVSPQPDALTLAHFAFYMRDPTFQDGTLGYLLDRADPRSGAQDEGPRIRVAARFDPAPDSWAFGGPPGATDALRATFRVADAPEGAWTTLTTLEVAHAWE